MKTMQSKIYRVWIE